MRKLLLAAPLAVLAFVQPAAAGDSSTFSPPNVPWQLPNANYASTSGTANTAMVATVANAVSPTATISGSQVSGAVAASNYSATSGTAYNANYAASSGYAATGGSAAVTKTGSCAVANLRATISVIVSGNAVLATEFSANSGLGSCGAALSTSTTPWCDFTKNFTAIGTRIYYFSITSTTPTTFSAASWLNSRVNTGTPAYTCSGTLQ
ncbi:MAG: hypothetical protein M0006_15915 [Magnetospirillum sp.]|nr:hypothetical protein [Magnetospirillum sp.]